MLGANRGRGAGRDGAALPCADRGERVDAPAEPGPDDSVLHLPHPHLLARHALPHLVEASIAPAVIFYVVLVVSGFRGAIVAALVWSWLALARRVLRHQRVPGLLVLGIALISLRTVVSFLTGSSFLYFAQPTLGTALVGMLFLASVVARRPLAERLANDFCPLDPDVMARPYVKKFFLRVSLLWCAVMTVNATFVMWLLLESSLRVFVVERTVVSTALTAGGIVISVLWFMRVSRAEGVTLRWGRALQAAPAGPIPT